MSIDIQARLELDARQFSSEGDRALAHIAASAGQAADNLKKPLVAALAEVQGMAQTALQLPRTATGSLDLSSQIASLRGAAAASEERATALREMAVAQTAAASSGRAVEESMRAEASAARIAADAEQENASAIRQRILALEAVQTELNRTASATQLYNGATGTMVSGTRQTQQATVQLGQQFQDFAVQVSSGQSAFTAFAQQMPQAAFALTGFQGKLGAVGAFLSGGWGVAVTVALVALAPFVAKILKGNEGLDDAVKKLREKASATDLDRQANEIWSKSVDGQVTAMRELNKQLEQQLKTQSQLQAEKLGEAKSKLGTILYGRGDAIERKGLGQSTDELREARADVVALRATRQALVGRPGEEGARIQLGRAEQRVDALQKRVDQLAADAEQARRTIRAAEIPIVERRIEGALDASTAATIRYTDALGELRQARQADRITEEEFERRGIALARKRDREVEAARAAQRTARGDSAGPLTTFISPIKGRVGSGFGRRARPTAGASSDHKGIDIAAAFGTPVKAAAGGVVVHVGKLGALGNAVLIDHGGGTISQYGHLSSLTVAKGQRVDQGDQVGGVGSTGVSTGNHLHYGVKVGGRYVDPRGGRFRTDETAVALRADRLETGKLAKETRDLAREQRELDSALDGLAGKYDPAAAAAKAYREELAKIAELQREGKINAGQALGLEASATTVYREQQARSIAEGLDRFAETDLAKSAVDAMDAGIKAYGRGMIEETDRVGERLRDVIGGAADLLGIRATGRMRFLFDPSGIEDQSREVVEGFAAALKRQGIEIDPRSIEKLVAGLAGAAAGSEAFGAIGGTIFGRKGAKIGGAAGAGIGAALGPSAMAAAGPYLAAYQAGQAIAQPIGRELGFNKTLTAFGLLPGAIGKLFGVGAKVKTGGSTIGGDQFGNLSIGSTFGNSGSAKSGSKDAAGAVISSLQSLADSLGAQITGAPGLTIGSRDGAFRVNTGGTSLKVKKGAVDFGKDGADEAIAFAVSESLKRGVITGVSAASAAILKSGADLQASIQKVVLIESIPRELKGMLDPVGAAIDELNRKFAKTVAALKEGGASAEQMAQAERLYQLQLDQTKSSTESVTSTLKAFLFDLKGGPNSPYSLRDQEKVATEQLKPFLDQIAAGQSIDQGKYQEAASRFLEVERQLYGSTSKFFDQQDVIQAATAKAIATIDNAAPITAAVESPFAKATAASSAQTASATQASAEILGELSATMANMQGLLARMAANDGAGGFSGFIGGDRQFLNQAVA